MNLVSKFFNELSARELYEILRVRVDIFVVEQRCAYSELDGVDYDSLHVYFEEDGKVQAYLRAFPKAPGIIQMGRVLTARRGEGLGGKLLKEGIEEIKARFSPEQIYIEAQTYAVGFYKREGFEICSDEFFEDGIAHVEMQLKL